MFLIKNNADLLKAYGYVIDDINRLILEFKIILREQNKEYLD